MQANEPWRLVKGSEDDRQRARTIIGVSTNLVVLLSTLLNPFMPDVSVKIRQFCNIPRTICIPSQFVKFLKAGHNICKPSPLFQKLEPTNIAKWKEMFDGTKMAENSKNSSRELYENVKNKFEVAKKLFEEKMSNKLDEENTELRQQIEKYKTLLGYGDLYVPPQAPTADTVSSISNETKIATQPVVVPVVNQQKNISQTAVAGAKGQPKSSKSKKSGDGVNGTAEDLQIDVGRLDLRIGRIIEAKKHPDADALYVETIDLGEGTPRTVVSGLVKFVPLDQMQNRLVVCLCNLKPAKMRGIESQAMVMCASTPEKVEILEVNAFTKPGDRVLCEPFQHRPDSVLNPKKKIWETVAPDLAVSDTGECVYKGHVLRIDGGNTTLKAPTLRNVPVK